MVPVLLKHANKQSCRIEGAKTRAQVPSFKMPLIGFSLCRSG